MYSKLITGYYRDARRASLPSLHHRWSLGICTNKKTSHIVYPNTWFTPSPPGDPHSFTHSPIHSLTHSLIHSFTHSLIATTLTLCLTGNFTELAMKQYSLAFSWSSIALATMS